MSNQQYVTLVAQGGTPVRLADQYGAPYPTTGHGSLVFNIGPTISDATLINTIIRYPDDAPLFGTDSSLLYSNGATLAYPTGMLGMGASLPPATLLDTGTAGMMTYDSNFLYFATATNTWRAIGSRSSAITYYVSLTGNDSNPGTQALPVLTAQAALNLCSRTAITNPGPFTIQFAKNSTYTITAGLTYTVSRFINSPLTFTGELDAGNISVTLQGTTTNTRASYSFIRPTQGVRMTFTNLNVRSFTSFVACSQGAGVSVDVNSLNCGRVVSLGNTGWADIQSTPRNWDGRDLNGVIVPDSTGLTCVIGCFYDMTQVDPATTGGNYTGLIIHHVDRGAVVDECGSGHMDFMRFQDCRIGVVITRGAGAPNMTGTQIWRCTEGVEARSAPNLLISDNQDFGQATVATSTASSIANVLAATSTASSIATVGGIGVLTVGGTLSGTFAVGQIISGGTTSTGTYIVALGTGSGGVGTYYVNKAQTVASAALNGTVYQLTIGGTLTGTFAVGQTIVGTDITDPTHIIALGSGTGGAGTYYVDTDLTLGPIAISANNGCDDNIVFTAAPTDAQIEETNLDTRWMYQAHSAVDSSTIGPNDLTERTVWNPFFIPLGRQRLRDSVRLRLFGTCSDGLVGTATWRLKYGSTTIQSWTMPATTSVWDQEINLVGLNRTDIRGQIRSTNGTASTSTTVMTVIPTTTGVVSLTTSTQLTLTIQMSNNADRFLLGYGRADTSMSVSA